VLTCKVVNEVIEFGKISDAISSDDATPSKGNNKKENISKDDQLESILTELIQASSNSQLEIEEDPIGAVTTVLGPILQKYGYESDAQGTHVA
jgi:hypothetical protein